MMFPPARENKNMRQIIGSVGCGIGWATSRVDDEVTRDLMWSESGRAVLEHYLPDFEQRLKEEYEPQSEQVTGKMRTATEIADELGRELPWVNPRLVQFTRRQKWLIKGGRSLAHYDEKVFMALKKESEEQNEIPFITSDMATLKDLIVPLNTIHKVAEPVLKKLGIDPVYRRSTFNGKVMRAYSVDVKLPLAEGIVKDRERRLAGFEATIAELSPRKRDELTTEEKKELLTAYQQRASLRKHYQRAKDVYERLLNEDSLEEAG
jgi:hypothetical protein